MRIKCIQDSYIKKHFFGPPTTEKIEGITKDKIYNAELFNQISGGGSYSVSNEAKFFIFNDGGQWDAVETEYFVPAETT